MADLREVIYSYDAGRMRIACKYLGRYSQRGSSNISLQIPSISSMSGFIPATTQKEFTKNSFPQEQTLFIRNMSMNIISHSLVDTESSVLSLVEELQSLPQDAPCLYVDLEGISLSRHGSISLITLFVQPRNFVYLVDVHKLQDAAFNTAVADGTTLKSVFESPHVIKVFFDLRNDSDALHHHFGVRLDGVEDIQLIENAAHDRQKVQIDGLDDVTAIVLKRFPVGSSVTLCAILTFWSVFECCCGQYGP
jgi:hypothetical protein